MVKETCITDFEPLGKRARCSKGKSILYCARQNGIGLNSVCGGFGTCKSCKIQLISGNVSKPTSSELECFSNEELSAGWRLACQTYPNSDCKLNIPPESMTTLQRTQIEGIAPGVKPDPAVRFCRLDLPAPSISDLRGDDTRLINYLKTIYDIDCKSVDIELVRTDFPCLRKWSWQCEAAVRNRELVALTPVSSPHLGLAIDLGSTKIAGYLVDLDYGRTLVAKGVMNPQISYGEDIISRLQRAMKSASEAVQMKQLIVHTINDLAVTLCTEIKTTPQKIVDSVVVGNTAMHHLFLGLPVSQLALAPYLPAVDSPMDIKSRDTGLDLASGAYVHVLPNVAGYVGADHVAMLLSTINKRTKMTLALDIGTNTEVSVVNGDEIYSVSCASGPAFEGGHITHGMRAGEGAIERLLIEDEYIKYQTIGDVRPVGICGSGLLDAVAQLRKIAVVDERGRMIEHHPRVRTNKIREFVLVDKADGQPSITINQHDIRELQLAKGAIRAGIQVLLEKMRISEAEIEKVIIAGAFGSYIDISSAISIGMLPDLPLPRFSQVGNAAGMGAKLALISSRKRQEAKIIAARIKYVELASAPDFQKIFLQSTYLGPYRNKYK